MWYDTQVAINELVVSICSYYAAVYKYDTQMAAAGIQILYCLAVYNVDIQVAIREKEVWCVCTVVAVFDARWLNYRPIFGIL